MDGIDVESKNEHSVDDLNFFDYHMQKRGSSLRDYSCCIVFSEYVTLIIISLIIYPVFLW